MLTMRRAKTAPATELMRTAMRRTRHSYTSLHETLLPAHPDLYRTKLHRIATGRTEPDLLLALSLESELGVPVESWPSLGDGVAALLQRRGLAA